MNFKVGDRIMYNRGGSDGHIKPCSYGCIISVDEDDPSATYLIAFDIKKEAFLNDWEEELFDAWWGITEEVESPKVFDNDVRYIVCSQEDGDEG